MFIRSEFSILEQIIRSSVKEAESLIKQERAKLEQCRYIESDKLSIAEMREIREMKDIREMHENARGFALEDDVMFVPGLLTAEEKRLCRPSNHRSDSAISIAHNIDPSISEIVINLNTTIIFNTALRESNLPRGLPVPGYKVAKLMNLGQHEMIALVHSELVRGVRNLQTAYMELEECADAWGRFLSKPQEMR